MRLVAFFGARYFVVQMLSHHMASLRDAGIVRARKDGRWMHYQLDHDVLDAIAALLGQKHRLPRMGGSRGVGSAFRDQLIRTADACRTSGTRRSLTPPPRRWTVGFGRAVDHPRPPDGFGPHARAPPRRNKATMRF